MRQTSESTRRSSDFTVQPSGTKCKGVSGICSPVSCHACIINIIIKQAYKKHVTLCGHVLYHVPRVNEIHHDFNALEFLVNKVKCNCLVNMSLNHGQCKTLPVFAYCLLIWHGSHVWRRILSISSEKAVKEYFELGLAFKFSLSRIV